MALVPIIASSAADRPDTTGRPGPWVADQGDGTYRNPVLHADYSDPDAVRVGEDYWMTSSSFSHVPGLPILHSRDLVNWTLVGHALPELVPAEAFQTPQHGKGVWAPSIRHHAGRFWIYYPDPDHGLYLVTAPHPRGPWSEPVLVKAGKGLIDPCPLWDEDGRVYLVHAWARSRAGINNVLTLLRLNADGTKVEEDLGVIINGDQVPVPGFRTLEGPKLYRRDGWYYVFAPAGGVTEGWQSVFRAKDVRGPYEHRIVLAQGSTKVNGPHQGALLDTPSGDWWFLHFQDKGAYGRIVHLQPVAWKDGWPLVGTGATTGAEKGEPVLAHAKPKLPVQPIAAPATSDEFSAVRLGPQWQWQANPQAGWHSLTARPGFLRLFGAGGEPGPAPYESPQLLLQKFPAPEFTVTAKLELGTDAAGTSAGLVVFGYACKWIGLVADEKGPQLVVVEQADVRKSKQIGTEEIARMSGAVWLRAQVSEGAVVRFSYSRDGAAFTEVPGEFQALQGRWVGAKIGLFAAGAGHADFDFFRVE
ncbi:MAG TPA: glycoside hydrolase 43 family protein [Opitutaceae bacterium]|nr:glycoside hydrolase 43 family protein [Opitutaceae bacterium]